MVRGLVDPASTLRHPPGDGAYQWLRYDAEQPDRHPSGSACLEVMPTAELVLPFNLDGHIRFRLNLVSF